MSQPDRSSQPAGGFLADVFQSKYREVTFSAIVFGIVLGAVMNMAITYAGLKIGFTIGGSAIAAVLGFGVLRGILGKGSILETNICQTIASTVNVACSGVIFTVPVLFLLNYDLRGGRFWLIGLACTVGGMLGVAFIIPLRKQMIDIERLRFPSAVAVAAILKSPGAGARKSLVLLAGVLVAMVIYLPVGLPQIKGPGGQPLWGYGDLGWRLGTPAADDAGRLPQNVDRDRDGKPDLVLTHEEIDLGRLLGLPDYLLLVFAITPLSFGAGYLTGRPGLMVLAGAILAVFVLNPAAFALDWMPATIQAHEAPAYAHRAFNRPLGIGMLLGGAFMGVVASMPAIVAALKSVGRAGKTRAGSDELGLKVLVIAILASVLLLYVASDLVSNEETKGGLLAGLNHHLRNAVIALVGAAWIWFAGMIIAQCTGMTDWSPISGMALLTVVLVMLLAGPMEVVGAVLLGAALCVATTCAADMMADLKTGYLVGAKPKRQQFVELCTAWMGPLISMGTLLLIVEANRRSFGVPIGPGTQTTAPQAQALQAIIQGIQGGEMPYALYVAGAVLGAGLGLGPIAGLGVLVGLSMYLPAKYIMTYGLGCIANMVVGKIAGRSWAEEWGVPLCAGLIVGEAILAMVINLFVLARN